MKNHTFLILAILSTIVATKKYSAKKLFCRYGQNPIKIPGKEIILSKVAGCKLVASCTLPKLNSVTGLFQEFPP